MPNSLGTNHAAFYTSIPHVISTVFAKSICNDSSHFNSVIYLYHMLRRRSYFYFGIESQLTIRNDID